MLREERGNILLWFDFIFKIFFLVISNNFIEIWIMFYKKAVEIKLRNENDKKNVKRFKPWV